MTCSVVLVHIILWYDGIWNPGGMGGEGEQKKVKEGRDESKSAGIWCDVIIHIHCPQYHHQYCRNQHQRYHRNILMVIVMNIIILIIIISTILIITEWLSDWPSFLLSSMSSNSRSNWIWICSSGFKAKSSSKTFNKEREGEWGRDGEMKEESRRVVRDGEGEGEGDMKEESKS